MVLYASHIFDLCHLDRRKSCTFVFALQFFCFFVVIFAKTLESIGFE